MRLDEDGAIVLSRSNLLALIAKLDGYPLDSACTLVGGSSAPGVKLKAEEDEVHYKDRNRGSYHISTELRIKEVQ